jgi:hypothetical protein
MRHKMKADLDKFRSFTEALGPFSVYGAGHYTQLLLHLSGVVPNHIYDSNPAKWGQRIVGKTVESGENVNGDSIVVICGPYNDEVCEMLSGRVKRVERWD